MSETFTQEAPIAGFLAKADDHRALLNTELQRTKAENEVATWVTRFVQQNGVQPSKEQLTEKWATVQAGIATTVQAADTALEQEYEALHLSYSAVAAGFEQLPSELEALRASRKTDASYTEETLARLLDLDTTRTIEAKLAGKSFDQIDAMHEAAVARQDIAVQRVLEQHMREKWPTANHTPDGLAAKTALESRIQAERTKRVPASVREGLKAIEKSWTSFQLTELRRIQRAQKFRIA